jgi:GntR family transcriptional regulator, transcriptional repressor for pyruvate dehydrogenase complex
MSILDPSGGPSLVRQAMQAVTDHIRGNNLRVGDSLPSEVHFAAQLGVSRPVVREALGALAALRLVDVGNGRRPRVASIDGSAIAASLDHAVMTAQVSVAEVWDVRRTLELRTAELAARSRTSAEAREIVEFAERMAAESQDLHRMSGNDIAFHQAIARASHNTLFVHIVNSFGPLMEVAVPTAWRTRTAEAQRELMITRHRDVARAIADSDPAAAVEAMEAHFDSSVGDLLKADFGSDNIRVR